MAITNDCCKLDIFPHIFPKTFFDRVKVIAETNPALAATIKRWLHIPVLWDLDARIRMMGKFNNYKQILTLSLPAIEFLAGPNESPALARLANDGMAEICAQHPKRFPGWVASLPMNNVPACLEEMKRTIAPRQRRHGGNCARTPRFVSRVRRLAADEQRFSIARRNGLRDTQTRRQGRTGIHQR